MTAILRKVDKTFTFEEQRVEINEIGLDLYNLRLQEQDDVELVDFTVATATQASGGGSLTYVIEGTAPNQIGKFTFTPADVFSGDYDDLTNKPTKLSDFTDDLNYSIPSDLNDLDDVLITNETSNHYLKWNGTKWVNEVLNEITVNKNPASTTPDLTRTITTTGVTLTYTPPDLSGFAAKVTTDDAAPFNPYDGQLWWKSDEGKLKIAYQDVDSLQWVDASPAGIQLSDLTVTEKQAAAQSKLEYDTATGIFEYTPTTAGSGSSGIALTDISVVKPNPAASQSGDVTYDNTSGEFTYTPPVIPTKLEDLDVTLTNLSDGHVLKWQTDKWVNAVDNVGTGGTGIALTDLEVVKPNPAASNTPDLTYNNLTGKFTYTPPIIPAAQIQTDWDQQDTTAVDYFKNRPTIPAPQVQSDWDATAPSGGLGVILNKPYVPPFAEVATNTIDLGKVLKWNGSEWAPGTDVSGGASTTVRGVYVPEVDKTATSSGAVYTNNDETITFPNSGSNMWKDVKFNKLDNDKVYEFRYQGYSTGTGSYNGFYFTDKQATRIDAATTQSGSDKISDHLAANNGTERWFAVNIDTQGGGDTGTYAADPYGVQGTWNWPTNGFPWDPNDTNNGPAITDWHFVVDVPRKKIWVRQYTEDYYNGKYWSKWRCNTADQGSEKCDPTDPTSQSSFYLRETGTGDYYFSFGCFVEAGGQGQCIVKAIDPMYSAFRNIGGGSSSLDLTSLSVTKATASGGGDLTYDNAGTFTYTPPDLGDYITLDDIPSPVVTSDTPPSNPNDGDLWWNSTQGKLKVYYEDVDTSQWVDTSGGGSGGGGADGNDYVTGATLGTGVNAKVLTLSFTDTSKNRTVDLSSIDTDTDTTYNVVDATADGLAPQLPASHGGKFLKADGSWEVPPNSGANVSISDNPPTNPTHGDLWWESDEGDLKIYYNDGNTSQWVTANQISGTFTQGGGASVTVSETAPSSPSQGDLWWKSDAGQLKIYYTDVDSSAWIDAAGGGGGPNTFTGTEAGLVPASDLATTDKFLKSDGSWDTFSETAQDLDSVLTEGNTATGKSLTVGTLNDAGGNVRSLPVNTQAAAYTIQTSDTGKMVKANGTITVSSTNTLSEGDIVTIYNATASDISIERSSVDMYLVGDSTSQNRTLAQKGIATLVCVGTNEYVLMGGGIT